MSGRFIALEGWEATGKSTQAAALGETLDALVTRQPGDSSIGAKVRELVLETDVDVTPRAEALLFAADRAQHVAEVVRPTLRAGRDVVCDRYLYSSVAYQGFGRGLDPAEVTRLSMWAAEGLVPDLVVLLDLPYEVAVRRLDRDRDRIERGDDGFHRRVHAAFAELAAAEPHRWAVIDADAAPDEVTARIMEVIHDRLGG
ncbi:MAG: dTMP kinase [Actinomycetota bacterium]